MEPGIFHASPNQGWGEGLLSVPAGIFFPETLVYSVWNTIQLLEGVYTFHDFIVSVELPTDLSQVSLISYWTGFPLEHGTGMQDRYLFTWFTIARACKGHVHIYKFQK